jgi:hypothetical protein
MVKWLQGKKTYLIVILGALTALVNFLAAGDFSIVAIFALLKVEGIAALIAAVRAAITKSSPNFPG